MSGNDASADPALVMEKYGDQYVEITMVLKNGVLGVMRIYLPCSHVPRHQYERLREPLLVVNNFQLNQGMQDRCRPVLLSQICRHLRRQKHHHATRFATSAANMSTNNRHPRVELGSISDGAFGYAPSPSFSSFSPFSPLSYV